MKWSLKEGTASGQQLGGAASGQQLGGAASGQQLEGAADAGDAPVKGPCYISNVAFNSAVELLLQAGLVAHH